MKNMPPQPQYNETRCHCRQLGAKLHREGGRTEMQSLQADHLYSLYTYRAR